MYASVVIPSLWGQPSCKNLSVLGRYSAAQRPLAAAAREPERSQLLPGLVPDPGYRTDVAELRPSYARASPGLRSGDALVCVTDGVIERTDGVRQFDDDVAVLVLAARPRDAYFRSISSASMTTPSPLAVSTALRIR